MNLKRKFALVAVPAVLALGGGALAVQAAPVHQAIAVPAAAIQTETNAPEPPESTTETVEAGEANLPGGGHNDTGANDNHEFTNTLANGVE